MKNIVILISGGGSNMAAIVKTALRDNWAHLYGARIAAVISNKAEAKGLAFAAEYGICYRGAGPQGVSQSGGF